MIDDWIGHLPSALQDQGQSLADQHVNVTVFPSEAARDVLRSLEHLDLIVLGGDFWQRADDRFAPAYDNWYVERAEGESSTEYRDRGFRVAQAAIDAPHRKQFAVSFTCTPMGEYEVS